MYPPPDLDAAGETYIPVRLDAIYSHKRQRHIERVGQTESEVARPGKDGKCSPKRHARLNFTRVGLDIQRVVELLLAHTTLPGSDHDVALRAQHHVTTTRHYQRVTRIENAHDHTAARAMQPDGEVLHADEFDVTTARADVQRRMRHVDGEIGIVSGDFDQTEHETHAVACVPPSTTHAPSIPHTPLSASSPHAP